MEVFFDCKSYSTKKLSSFKWTFYGIAGNTAAAAMAFEMAYNLILNWSMSKIGVSTRHSYSIGVADSLYNLAQEEKREEIIKARKKEEEIIAKCLEEEQCQRQKEIDRLNFQVSILASRCC